MGRFYVVMALTFFVLLIINVIFAIINIIYWATNGLQSILHGMNFIQRIYYSEYAKWIILVDGLWWIGAIAFAINRKHYKTTDNFYLQYSPILNPSICVVIPTYNEELAIKKVLMDFKSAMNVKHLIVIDNHSTDNTVAIAQQCGARVITKEKNMGYGHSCTLGLIESLKTDTNIVVLVEGDGTCNSYDISKMIPYLDNCDMVVGTRQLQVLSEKGNQIKMVYVWGNFFLAKALQIKFFSLLHMGSVSLTDVGCLYRAIRKEALEKIISEFLDPKTHEVIPGKEFVVFFTIESLKNNLRVVEIPITFKKRIGISKTGSDKKLQAIIDGFYFLWYILRS
ncbi:MAG: glycosyltransferase family 2 protein [Nitrososphaera sp.]|jgi:glycosyltransferase involved in cell wall biosynthesis